MSLPCARTDSTAISAAAAVELGAGAGEDRAAHPGPPRQAVVGGVHDCVDLLAGDVTTDGLDRGRWHPKIVARACRVARLLAMVGHEQSGRAYAERSL